MENVEELKAKVAELETEKAHLFASLKDSWVEWRRWQAMAEDARASLRFLTEAVR